MPGPAESETSSRWTVLLLDGQALRRAALLSFLEAWAADEGVALLPSAPGALPQEVVEAARCALVILNLGGVAPREAQAFERMDALLRALPSAPLAVLSDLESPDEVVAALRAGARGFLPTSTDPEIARHALTFILRGGSYFPPAAMIGRAAGGRNQGGGGTQQGRDGAARHRATHAEAPEDAILRCLRDGLSNRMIGRLLAMPEPTVKVHVRRILRRFGVANRTQAALAAFGVAALPASTERVNQAPLPAPDRRDGEDEAGPPRLKGVA